MEKPQSIDPLRILIHADNADREAGMHPQWRGDGDQELTQFPFGKEHENALTNMNGMTEINYHLERVLDKAPSDSTANLLVRKTKDGFKAFLHIRSANQKFKSFISGRRLMDVVEHTIRDVRSQIDDWKSRRQLADENI